MTYAERAVEETRRREGGIPTIIDITATTVTAQTDGEILQPVFVDMQAAEEAVNPPLPRKSLKYSVREVSEIERRSRQEIERMRDRAHERSRNAIRTGMESREKRRPMGIF